MKIKITRYIKVDVGSLKGNAQVLFEDIGLTVNGVKVIKKQDGGVFYAFPSERVENDMSCEANDTDSPRYREHCAFYIKGAYAEFHKAMTSAFRLYFAENPQEGEKQKEMPGHTGPQTSFFEKAAPVPANQTYRVNAEPVQQEEQQFDCPWPSSFF